MTAAWPGGTVVLVLLAAGVASFGCGGGGEDGPAAGEPGGDRASGAGAAGAGGAADAPPRRFGFGSPADEARVALWDVDVRPDGTGLPPARGSVAEGEAVYARACAACHGPTGVEGPYDRLVGTEPWEDFPPTRAVGTYWPYATTLFDYIRRSMPQDSPGSLTPAETYAVVAWILARNGLLADDAVLDAATLPRVAMPARHRFVPDDRRGGPEVR